MCIPLMALSSLCWQPQPGVPDPPLLDRHDAHLASLETRQPSCEGIGMFSRVRKPPHGEWPVDVVDDVGDSPELAGSHAARLAAPEDAVPLPSVIDSESLPGLLLACYRE